MVKIKFMQEVTKTFSPVAQKLINSSISRSLILEQHLLPEMSLLTFLELIRLISPVLTQTNQKRVTKNLNLLDQEHSLR